MTSHDQNDPGSPDAGDGTGRDWIWEHIARSQRAAQDPVLSEDDRAFEAALYAQIDDAELAEAARLLDELEAEEASHAQEGETGDAEGGAEAPILGGPSRFRRFMSGQASGLSYAAALLIAVLVAGVVRGRVLEGSGGSGPGAFDSAAGLQNEPLASREWSVTAISRLMNYSLFAIDVARARVEQSPPAAERAELLARIDWLKAVARGERAPDPGAQLSDSLHEEIMANIESGRVVENMIPRFDELFEQAMAGLDVAQKTIRDVRSASTAGLSPRESDVALGLEMAYETVVSLILDR